MLHHLDANYALFDQRNRIQFGWLKDQHYTTKAPPHTTAAVSRIAVDGNGWKWKIL